MTPTLFKASKLLLIEKKTHAYTTRNSATLPEEFHKLLLPQTDFHFRQDNDCDILSQHLNAGPFSLWLHDIFTKDDILLLPYTPYHIYTLNFMYEDSLQVDNRAKSNFTLEEGECNLFNLTPGMHKIPMSGDKKILSVHINIQPSAVPHLLIRFPQLGFLTTASNQAVHNTINQHPHYINPVCDFLIQKILSCRYTGSRAYYFIQRCCADLLLNFATQEAAAQKPLLFSHLLHMDTYTHLFNYLVGNNQKGQSVAELAYNSFLSPQQLEEGFLQHFSISIYDFLFMLKMMATYQLLYKNHLGYKDIAEAAGYKDVSEMKQLMEYYYNCSLEKMR